MKTLIRFLFMAAFTSLLFACSEQELGVEGLAEVGLKAASTPAVFVVNPGGGDDTPALQQAFEDAKAAGPGSVVQLVVGTYHLNFIEIREFFGTFRGAGKGVTVITPCAELDDDPLISQNLTVELIRFVGGDVLVQSMTFTTPPGELNPGSVIRVNGLLAFSSITAQYTSENEYIRAVADNLEFTGHKENTVNGLVASSAFLYTIPGGVPLSNMDIEVTNCSFDGIRDYGALIMEMNGGNIVVGTKGNGNTFYNNYYASLGIWHNVNVDISVVDNTFYNPSGTRFGIELYSSPYPARLEQVVQTKVTTCSIEQNVFNITGGTGGLLVNDRRRYFNPDDLPMLVQVKNNTFYLSNNGLTGIGCFNMHGMVIRNNKFEGNGQYGVRIMGPTPYPFNENGLMLGNNFSNSTFSVASVLLDNRTNNWTIVGGDLGETVVDMTNGAGGHLITGMNVNTSDVPLGHTITDNLEEMREGMK